MTAMELARDLRKLVRFRFLTVDKYSVKLWHAKPQFNRKSGYWIGRDVRGFIDIEDAKLIAPLDFSTAIVEVP